MIPRKLLPSNLADWRDVPISFPPLPHKIAESPPRSEDDVFNYIQLESADLDEAQRSRLRFVRTAQVGEANYWLWEYTESNGDLCYVTLRHDPGISNILSLDWCNGLTHEQFLLADYYNEV